MIRYIIKEILLIYLITSIIVVYPNFPQVIIFYIQVFNLFILGVLSVLIVFHDKEFFQKKYNIVLVLAILFIITYSALTLSGINPLFTTLVYILITTTLGRFIGFTDLKLGFFSTISLVIVFLMLLRVAFASIGDIFNFIYYTNGLYLDLKSVGYNFGRTGWSISLIFFICFLKGFKNQLSNDSFLKKLLINSVFVTSFICIFNSDSRTGIAALIILLLIWNISFISNIVSSRAITGIIVAIEIFLLIISGSILAFIFEDTRLSTLTQGEDISNGRLEGISIGWEIIKRNSIIGTYPSGSYNLMDYGLDYPEIHIVWLNLIAMYGIPLILLTFLCLTYYTYLSLRNSLKLKYIIDLKTLYFLIIFGFFVTLVEPNGIISFVSFVSLYWFTLGIFLTDKVRGI